MDLGPNCYLRNKFISQSFLLKSVPGVLLGVCSGRKKCPTRAPTPLHGAPPLGPAMPTTPPAAGEEPLWVTERGSWKSRVTRKDPLALSGHLPGSPVPSWRCGVWRRGKEPCWGPRPGWGCRLRFPGRALPDSDLMGASSDWRDTSAPWVRCPSSWEGGVWSGQSPRTGLPPTGRPKPHLSSAPGPASQMCLWSGRHFVTCGEPGNASIRGHGVIL